MKKVFIILFYCLLSSSFFAQSTLEAFVFEQNNRGFIQGASVMVFQLPENYVRGELTTDKQGAFSLPLAPGTYRITTKKELFYPQTDTITIAAPGKFFHKVLMERKPGYLLDATIAESRTSPATVVDGISGARVEIYNRTQRRPELILLDHPNAFFQFTLEQGNHYTIMIRKPGFIAKRIEARVNVEGCIICVDGVREVGPGMTDNLTSGNKLGTLLSNIELERAQLNKKLLIKNIYYNFDRPEIRPDAARQLDKVVTMLRDNPGLTVELGSHTDCRGDSLYNDTLSQRRAEAAVAYIVEHGIPAWRITAKGYGEQQLVNGCADGVACTEAQHQENRRTELKITSVNSEAVEMKQWKSLEEIIQEEEQ